MGDVFISYTRKERQAVERLALELRQLELAVWFDASLNAGSAFSDEIDREARAAKAVLVCWSPAARESQWVKAEALIGFEDRKLAACYVAGPDGFKPPAPFNSIHAEDLRAWIAEPSPPHAGWKSILRQIGKLCGRDDIESYGALDVHAPTSTLRNWIERHAASPLFMAVEGLLRARETEEAERSRIERDARWKRAVEGLDRQSSKAIRAFLELWSDHPEAAALRASLPAIEQEERRRAERAAYEGLDKTSSTAVAEFLRNWPDHPEASSLRKNLPRIEREERARQEQARRRRGAARRRSLLPLFLLSAAVVIVVGALVLNTGVLNQPVETPVTAPAPRETFSECDSCAEMVVIPGGSFMMGSDEPDRAFREGPQHWVSIERFALSKHEITFAQWDACVEAGGCGGHRPSDEGWGRGIRPVVNVNWNDAQAYVAWLNTQTRGSYRLPTEAEWEYAARAGTTTAFSTGPQITPRQAQYDWSESYAGSPTQTARDRTAEVGSFPANAFGLHDMHGNVVEWVEDCFNETYSGAPTNGSAWTSGDCTLRGTRGGAWYDIPLALRSENRYAIRSTSRENGVGFRVAKTL